MEEETELIRAFVITARRERLIELLANPKRRRRATSTLAHFHHWDPRWVVALRPDDQSPAAIQRLLQRSGAGDSCHVISEAQSLDGKRLLLSEALECTVGHGMGTVVSCVPGRVAFYEGEDPADRCLLLRPTASPLANGNTAVS